MRGLVSSQTSLSLLKIISKTNNLRLGKSVHAKLIISNLCDIIESNYLIDIYAKCGHLTSARQVFDLMPNRNVVSYSSLMAGYFHDGCPSEVLSVLKIMSSDELWPRPNEFIFATVLASCSDMQAFKMGQQCHAYVLKSGLSFHSYIRNVLLHMYSTCSGVEDALKVFYSMPGVDVISFNSMINSFLEHGRIWDAMEVLNNMVSEIWQWDHITYVAVLGLCADSKDSLLGRQVHCQILNRRFESNLFVGSAIVDMYGKSGDSSSARSAFNELSCRNVISWTTIMAACTQNASLEESLKLFIKMQVDCVQPNDLTYTVALNTCAGLAALTNGNSLKAHIEKTGYMSHLIVCNALINMYSKSGSIEDAEVIFVDLTCKDTITWNCMINGYSHNGLGRKALETFHDMLVNEVSPTYVTFIGVLLACGHLGLVDEGLYYVNHFMRNLGISPGVEHHTCIVGLLCRAGLLDEADRYMRTTHSEWDLISWRTLLSACQTHRKFGLGKKVSDYILQLYPNDVGTYILISNMYAKANRWDAVVKVRRLMREKCIKKEPGVSWIQVRNELNVFASEDNRHPLIEKIHKRLVELLDEIKGIGYVPITDSVLHDVEEEHKEGYLKFHSEKLAIVFGLISTPWGAPIHVIKNLRMCDDCHIAIKLFSKVTKRKMVVRDVNRFHCFQDGICSCNDYW
ncbi:pentatricopeptide repeat-containing protein At5g39680 [Dendrobium catenatum]|uniref:Pentatricopeptide repeat-containing protein n=1 Tax=Dendrobium catenatum TaxID=906689 RepID=A0A2I0X4P3_9ASPA|nr:pentatricopeptide repeat-containing protein At5g39680 [Dendrobium catenatum]PKU82888.1 Pentatricopeptide repeat-containing protein [Dendrobium catenatum]